MKKLVLAAVAASAIAAAAPALADQTVTAADPFVSTQGIDGLLVPLITFTIIIAATSGT